MVSRQCLLGSNRYILLSYKTTVLDTELTNSLLALLNLHWAKNPEALEEPLNRAMAALVTLIAWSSSAWYLRRGVKASGILTATAGLFQAWAALH
jgi:hypothetical protein